MRSSGSWISNLSLMLTIMVARMKSVTNTEYDIVHDEIRSYQTMEDDWDGEGAVTFSMETLNNACNLLRMIDEEYPNIVAPVPGPCGNNTVDLWWSLNDTGDKYCLLINVDHKGNVDWYGDNNDSPDTYTVPHSKIVKGTAAWGHFNLDFIKDLIEHA